MGWNKLIRQIHRWVSCLFTVSVVANIVAVMTLGEPPEWMMYMPLPFLFILLPTGIYMFILPYIRRRAHD